MEHAGGYSRIVCPERHNNITAADRVADRVAIALSIAVSVCITFSGDAESVITISERIDFHLGFCFTVTDIR